MHIIHQIRVESRADSVKLARKVDRAVAEWLDDHLPIRLETCFDRITNGRTLRIERLEIDLGAMSWVEFERGFVERVAAAVDARIRPDGSLPAVEQATQAELELPREGERLEAWLFFLRHGHLPWWFADARWDEISSLGKLRAADPERMIGELGKLAEYCPAALVRLARHATAEELAVVFGLETAVTEFSRMRGSASAVNVIVSWLGRLPSGAEMLLRMFPLLSRVEREALGARPVAETRKISQGEPALFPPPGNEPGTDRAQELDTVLSTLSGWGETAIPADAGLPVRTAGLVLLHPFLTRFFRHLGWLDDAGGMNSDFRWHAVQALQFLALGKCGLPEPTLVMEKTLCGIPLHEPAELPVLDDAVRAECDHLLEAVIRHWSVLGKTSVDGLRDSFLARPGLLRSEETRTCLTVEKRPYDMLLGSLPWSMGPVMFKWLDRPIQVRWREES